MFYIAVPPSSIVTCHTIGSTSTIGDADLYAKFGSEPDAVSSYEASSISVSANEKVGPLSPSISERTLYVMIYAYTAFNDVMLWCDLEYVTSQPTATPTTRKPTSANQQLTPGQTQTSSITTAKQNQMFYIAVPPSSIVTCHTIGSTSTIGDADLYAKFGSEPDAVSSYEASSISVSANEKVGPLSPSISERTLYVMIYAYTAFNDVMLWCDLGQPTATPSTRKPTAKPTTRKPNTRKPTTSKPTTAKPTT